MITLLLAFTLASPAQFHKAGNTAYTALRAFELVELVNFHGHQKWPTAEQHTQIIAKCAILNENVHDSLILRFDMQEGEPASPQALSLLTSQHGAAEQLDSYVDSTAPADARSLMAKVRQAFDKLFAMFPPPGEFHEHPL